MWTLDLEIIYQLFLSNVSCHILSVVVLEFNKQHFVIKKPVAFTLCQYWVWKIKRYEWFFFLGIFNNLLWQWQLTQVKYFVVVVCLFIFVFVSGFPTLSETVWFLSSIPGTVGYPSLLRRVSLSASWGCFSILKPIHPFVFLDKWVVVELCKS